MKKTTKFLAVILALITLMSSFSIISGAISSKSSAKELLNYYEDCIIKTSAKEDKIKAVIINKDKETADYSSLKGEDLEITKKENEEWEIYTGEWYEYESDSYFYCDKYEDYYVDGRSEFVDYFSIKRDIRRYDLKFKSAKYSKAENGDVILTFVYTCYNEWTDDTATYTYTATINSKGYLKTLSCKDVGIYEVESIESNAYKVNYTYVDTYKFVYNKVDAEAIEVPENTITLGKDEEYKLDVTIKPDNATYKDYYINDYDMDWEVADYYFDEEGNCYIYEIGPGKTTFEICTYSGDVVETVEVVVEYTFLERLTYFFENLSNEITWAIEGFFYEIQWFFEDLFYTVYTDSYEDGYYEDDYEYYEEEFICVGV